MKVRQCQFMESLNEKFIQEFVKLCFVIFFPLRFRPHASKARLSCLLMHQSKMNFHENLCTQRNNIKIHKSYISHSNAHAITP